MLISVSVSDIRTMHEEAGDLWEYATKLGEGT